MHPIITRIKEISQQVDDDIVFKSAKYSINKDNFLPIIPSDGKITFIDGGQAEIIKKDNLSLQFIRVYACTFENNNRISESKKEFYALIYAKDETNYQAEIFGDFISNFTVSSMDETVREGLERSPISKIGNMARRFAELQMASQFENAVIDGSLDMAYKGEEKYMGNISALAKSGSIYTANGNSAFELLNRIGPKSAWKHKAGNIWFVKLHEKSNFVFRFEGDESLIAALAANSNDPVLLGYPYGLIWADKMARVSNAEKELLKTQFSAKLGKDFMDVHGILDRIG